MFNSTGTGTRHNIGDALELDMFQNYGSASQPVQQPTVQPTQLPTNATSVNGVYTPNTNYSTTALPTTVDDPNNMFTSGFNNFESNEDFALPNGGGSAPYQTGVVPNIGEAPYSTGNVGYGSNVVEPNQSVLDDLNSQYDSYEYESNIIPEVSNDNYEANRIELSPEALDAVGGQVVNIPEEDLLADDVPFDDGGTSVITPEVDPEFDRSDELLEPVIKDGEVVVDAEIPTADPEPFIPSAGEDDVIYDDYSNDELVTDDDLLDPDVVEEVPVADEAPVEYQEYESPYDITGENSAPAPATNAPSSGSQNSQIQQFLEDLPDLNDISLSQEGRQRSEDYLYDQYASRLDPKYDEAEQQLQIDLRNRGLVEGDAAYDSAMDNFNRDKTDAYQQAKYNSVTKAGEEAQRNFQMEIGRRAQIFGEAQGMSQDQIDRLKVQTMQQANALQGQSIAQQGRFQQGQLDLQNQGQTFGQEMQVANYQNRLRQQQIAEEMARRSQSLNELNALLTGAQVSTANFQGYNQAGNAGGTDYTGAAQDGYQGALDSFNASNQAIQGWMSGASSMYGAGMFGGG